MDNFRLRVHYSILLKSIKINGLLCGSKDPESQFIFTKLIILDQFHLKNVEFLCLNIVILPFNDDRFLKIQFKLIFSIQYRLHFYQTYFQLLYFDTEMSRAQTKIKFRRNCFIWSDCVIYFQQF